MYLSTGTQQMVPLDYMAPSRHRRDRLVNAGAPLHSSEVVVVDVEGRAITKRI